MRGLAGVLRSRVMPNAKLSRPDQATELLRKVVFYTDRKSEQNRRVAARGWLQRLVRLFSASDNGTYFQENIRREVDRKVREANRISLGPIHLDLLDGIQKLSLGQVKWR